MADEYNFIDVAIDSADPFNTGSRDLPEMSIVPSIPNVEAMSIVSASIPFTYPVIDATNNTFTIEIPDTPGTTWTVYLVPGTYTITDFITMINNVLLQAFDVTAPFAGGVSVSGGAGIVDDLVVKYDLKIFQDNAASTITFYTGTTGSAAASNAFTVSFDKPTGAFTVMGFEQASYTATQETIYTNPSYTNYANVYYVESPFTFNMSGPGFIHVISDLAQIVKDGVVRTSRNTDSILQVVPVNQSYRGTIQFLNPTNEKIHFSKTTISRVQCGLLLGHRSEYCPGTDYQYYNANGTPKIQKNLSLLCQSFQIVIRFYSRRETSEDYVLKNGDKYAHTQSAHSTGFVPSMEQFDQRDVKTRKRDRKGLKMPEPNRDRISSYPTQPPGSRIPPPNYRRLFPVPTNVR